MNNSNKLAFLISVGTLMFSINAHAKPYISAQIGAASGNELLTDSDCCQFGGTGRLAAGYLWDFSDRFKLGIEGGAQLYQNIENQLQGYYDAQSNPVSISIAAQRKSADILAVAQYFFTQRFDVFAKLGAAYVHQSFPTSFNGNSHYNGEKLYIFSNGRLLKPESHFVPKLAVGAGYNIQKNLNLNFAVNQEVKNESRVIPGVRSYLIGVTYSFS